MCKNKRSPLGSTSPAEAAPTTAPTNWQILRTTLFWLTALLSPTNLVVWHRLQSVLLLRPKCKAATPPVKFSNFTSAKPASRIIAANSVWFGKCEIESGRYS